MAPPAPVVPARPIDQCRDTYGALEVLVDLAQGKPVDQACRDAAVDAASKFTGIDAVPIRRWGLDARHQVESRNDWDVDYTLVPRFDSQSPRCPKDLNGLLACTLPAFVSSDMQNKVERYLDAQVVAQERSQSAAAGYAVSCQLVTGAGLQSGIVCTPVLNNVAPLPNYPGLRSPRGPCFKNYPEAL